MVYKNEAEVLCSEAICEEKGKLIIKEPELFRQKDLDNIVDTIILSDSSVLKKLACWVAYSAGISAGIIPSSIQGLYDARGKSEVSGFTVPAINLRTLTFDLARAIFRIANKINAGAFIFEIAKSEIGYTDQRPLEYTSVIILAALREGYHGSIFIQGDHFQLKAKNFLENLKGDQERVKNVFFVKIVFRH